MSLEPVKLNRLGKPMKRGNKGQFAVGNQEGAQFGKEMPATGRPPGVRNVCTIIKEIALAKDPNTGLTNIEWIVHSMVEAKQKLWKYIRDAEPTSPGYSKALANYTFLSSKIMEQLAKYSGDYTAKFQAEISDQLSDEEKTMMEKALKNAKK
jgi:hypothetical protein